MRAASEAGLRVPHDVSVIGVDDIPLGSYLLVSLSTIAQPIASMARRTARMLIERVESKEKGNAPTQVVFPTAFIRRESVGKAP
jgi:LacI family transcriptional regulator